MEKRGFCLLATVLLCLLFLAGCAQVPFEEKIGNIEKVIWHGDLTHSFIIQNADKVDIITINADYQSNWPFNKKWEGESGVKIIADVSANEKMWARAEGYKVVGGLNKGFLDYAYLEIHLHSAKEIDGGVMPFNFYGAM